MRLPSLPIFTAAVLFFSSGCKDDQPVESTDIETDTLQLFGGWSASVPIEPQADSYSFLGNFGGTWKTIFTKDIESDSPSSIEIGFIPGTDLEREVLFAIPNFRGVYRVPSEVVGTISWEGVHKLKDGQLQLFALTDGERTTPCLTLRFNTVKSEQDIVPNP